MPKKNTTNRRRLNRRRVTLKDSLQRGVGFGRRLIARGGPVLALALIGLSIPYLALQAYYFVGSSDYFALETIDVRGNDRAATPALLAMAGLKPGMNIFEVDPEAMQPLIEAHPWVVEARVEAELPRMARIHVTEHEPQALLVSDEGLWLVDKEGNAFKSLDEADDFDALVDSLPLFTGLEVHELEQDFGKQLFVEALNAMELYGQAGLAKVAPLSEIHMDRVIGVSLVTQSGVEIRLGRGKLKDRMLRIVAVMKSLNEDGRKAEYILVDHEEDLDRVSVGMAPVSGKDADGASRW